MDVPDINVILSQMAEMQKQLSELQSLKKTVEEKVCESVRKKLENMDLLNDGDLTT